MSPNGVRKPEQIKLIMECHQSGLSDYQWCRKQAIFFQADGISLFSVKDISNHILALINTLMSRPSGDWTHVRITGIFI